MNYHPINFRQKLGLFDDHWQPRVIADLTPHFDQVTQGEPLAPTPPGGDVGRRRIWTLEGWRGTWPLTEKRWPRTETDGRVDK